MSNIGNAVTALANDVLFKTQAKIFPKEQEVKNTLDQIAENIKGSLRKTYRFQEIALQPYATLTKEDQGIYKDSISNMALPGSTAVKTAGKVAGKKVISEIGEQAPKAFEGFQDITSGLIGKLRGMRSVKPETITNLTKGQDIKQAERDIALKVLNKYQPSTGKIPAQQIAQDIKDELLPLNLFDNTNKAKWPIGHGPKYENISLPTESRGNVANYREHIYESPIKTSAGEVHFGSTSNNYFAHTRVEDLEQSSGLYPSNFGPKEPTRRVIEIQSDLFQKGRLEGEANLKGSLSDSQLWEITKGGQYDVPPDKLISDLGLVKGDLPNLQKWIGNTQLFDSANPQLTEKKIQEMVSILEKMPDDPRTLEIAKLKPYENTWHERVIREEVKKAAQDGKTKLQFPTGETAMKIEGLGNSSQFYESIDGEFSQMPMTADELEIGKNISSMGDNTSGDWIITDVLEDGKFKAVPKNQIDMYKQAIDNGRGWGGPKEMYGDPIKMAQHSGMEEQFDISGKVDQSNPIYKFYESEVGKYLKKKYNAQLITDPQGVKWWELDIKPEQGTAPIEAFGIGAIGLGADRDSEENKIANQAASMSYR